MRGPPYHGPLRRSPAPRHALPRPLTPPRPAPRNAPRNRTRRTLDARRDSPAAGNGRFIVIIRHSFVPNFGNGHVSASFTAFVPRFGSIFAEWEQWALHSFPSYKGSAVLPPPARVGPSAAYVRPNAKSAALYLPSCECTYFLPPAASWASAGESNLGHLDFVRAGAAGAAVLLVRRPWRPWRPLPQGR